MPTFPVVHLNGTSKARLLEDLSEAADTLYTAIGALRRTAPHGRDYYILKDDLALVKATAEHKARLDKLTSVLGELTEIAIDVSKQGR